MADSEDEFDRRNAREKFRPERNDYDRRDDRRPRDVWEDREWAGRGRDKGRRDRFSPPHDVSPPRMKRMRRDWEDGFPHYDAPFGALPAPPIAVPAPPPPGWAGAGDVAPASFTNASAATRGSSTGDHELQTQPPMLTFKQFMSSQDDSITDMDAVKKFGDYKMDFQKQQINDFFTQHKDEEWFRMKYHPDEYGKRLEEARAGLMKRCKVFIRLLEMNRIATISIDVDHTEDLVKLLDAAVILMEGGNEFDLKILDGDVVDNESGGLGTIQKRFVKDRSPVIQKRDRARSGSSVDDDKTPPRFTEPLKLETASDAKATEEAAPSSADAEAAKLKQDQKQRRKSGVDAEESDSGSISDGDEDAAKPSDVGSNVVTSEAEKKSESSELKNGVTDPDKDDDGLEEGEERDEPKPRALHKTSSIFLRNLPPAVTKQEVEEVCKRYPGFVRLFLQDPQPERRFLRRGWVTFDHTVNIKEICWNLNNIRLRECEVGAIVNRELKQRIRTVNGITMHRPIARQDIRHAAKVIQVLDSRWNIWVNPNDEKKDAEKEQVHSLMSLNPLLKGIAEYLVDEGNYEEQALLGVEEQEDKPKEGTPEVVVEKDESLLKVLDKLILYLRIVYSLDYYSAIEYPNEDEMPHRCGIMHARGPAPTVRITQAEVNEWNTSFEQRIAPFIQGKVSLSDGEMVRLGKKSTNDEVEKFMVANTQELGKDKWLCPLSGKKFKGPEFVRKHILTKHAEKLDEVKKEVDYFNNFLKDPKRPQLPEHPTSKPSSSGSQPLPAPAAAAREAYLAPSVGSFHGPLPPPPPAVGYRPPVVYPGGPAAFPTRGGPDPFRGNDFRRDRFPSRRDGSGPRSESRRAVNYRDLDAPPDVEAS